jgi:nitroreductase
MKKALFFAAFGLLALLNVTAQDSRAAFALNHYASRSFIAGTISAADLDTVVQAGIRAPSARNAQPWHFTVVKSAALAKKIIPDIVDGNVIIIVSAAPDSRRPGSEYIDCGLAAESIYLTAQAIGLGSRIYTGPIDGANKIKAELGLPKGYEAVVLVRVGKTQAVDAASAASSRQAASALVNYK